MLLRPLALAALVLPLVLAFAPGRAAAQYCGSHVSYGTGYNNGYNANYQIHERTIVQPVAVPVLVPSTVFQYMPALGAPCTTCPPPQAPVGAPQCNTCNYAVAPTGHGSSSNLSIADVDTLIKLRLEALLSQASGGAAPPLANRPFGLPAAKPEGGAPGYPGYPPAGPGYGAPAPVGGTDIAAKAMALLTEKCANCHSAPSPSKGFAMFDSQGKLLDLPRSQRSMVLTAVDTAYMPQGANFDLKNAKALNDEQVTLIRAWASESFRK